MKNINVKGAIVPSDEKWIYNLFDIEATCPKDVNDVLNESAGEDIRLTINSGGGDVFSASEIYTELMDHNANVESRIVGVAASAASVIAMAGRVKMSPTAQLMIHNAAMVAAGDHRQMDKASNLLKSVNKSVSTAYQQKTGMTEDDLLSLMDEETWMNADAAKEKGFVDEIMFEEQPKAVANATVTNMIPQEVIDGVRNGLLKDKQPSSGINKETLDGALANMKQDILNELKQNNEPTPIKNDWLF